MQSFPFNPVRCISVHYLAFYRWYVLLASLFFSAKSIEKLVTEKYLVLKLDSDRGGDIRLKRRKRKAVIVQGFICNYKQTKVTKMQNTTRSLLNGVLDKECFYRKYRVHPKNGRPLGRPGESCARTKLVSPRSVWGNYGFTSSTY